MATSLSPVHRENRAESIQPPYIPALPVDFKMGNNPTYLKPDFPDIQAAAGASIDKGVPRGFAGIVVLWAHPRLRRGPGYPL
jgi:hypothetical protein